MVGDCIIEQTERMGSGTEGWVKSDAVGRIWEEGDVGFLGELF